ncbi:MAG: adenosylcobinamide-phosphate synthase CbiB [Candidatus Omnitrophota bacterium]
MMNQPVIIISAFIMDLLFGDPQWRWHPMRLMGCLISFFEKMFYHFENKREAGQLVVLLVVGASYVVSFGAINLFYRINYLAGAFVSVFLIYVCLSIKDLRDESMRVHWALSKKDIGSARGNLSMIVGRDTNNLNEKEITRATVETIAESTVDGVISPLFFAFLGGAPLCVAYKAVNALDSMLGSRNEKYKDFGWASAKLDELLNYIPARISGVLFFITGICLRQNAKAVLKNVILKKEFIIGQSSRIPESAMAELLGVRLGGINYYQGIAVCVPFMGRDKNSLTSEAIKTANRIMYIVSFIALAIGASIFWLIKK